MPKLEQLLANFNDNFRICQKWAKVQTLDFFVYPDLSPENISKTQKYSGFVIRNVRSRKVTAGF